MKKVLLSIVSAMAFLAMTAAPDVGKAGAIRVLSTPTDCLTQTEMMMLCSSVDGFGLDAEEYELLMSEDFGSGDDLMSGFTVPTCAGGGTTLNGGRPGGLDNPPIDVVRPKSFNPDDLTDGTGGGTTLNGGRPGGLDIPPIDIVRPKSFNPDDLTDGTGDGKKKRINPDDLTDGTGGGTTLNGGRPGGLNEPPIDTVRPW